MRTYAQTHANKLNLTLHLFAVPLFILANIGFLLSIAKLKLLPALICVELMALSLWLQRRGHALEQISPEPFKNGWNFAYRLYVEQFYTFPRFALSGGWKENFFSPLPPKELK